MSSVLDVFVSGKAIKYKVGLMLFPPVEGSTVRFLQEDGGTVNFRVTDNRPAEVENWEIATNHYTQAKVLRIATMETGFGDVIRRSSHAAIGSTVYSIDRASIAPPTKDDPYYQIDISRTGETFT